MLVKGNIPHSEPTVSIGLVLPEDNQTELMLSFSNLNAFKFLLDGTPLEIAETDLTIRVQNNELAVNGHQVSEMWCVPLIAEKDDYIQLNPIRAGRGFHWGKNIKIKVLGDVRISLKDGQLFVVNHVTLEKYIMCVATSEMMLTVLLRCWKHKQSQPGPGFWLPKNKNIKTWAWMPVMTIAAKDIKQ